jgi:hypothetical protein
MDICCSKDHRYLSVWYPMDHETYYKQIADNNSKWLRHGVESRVGIAKATADWGSDDHIHPWFYSYVDGNVMDTV